MDYFLSVLADVFRWSSLDSTEKTLTLVAWLAVVLLLVGIAVVAVSI